MSNINRYIPRDTLTHTLGFVLQQRLKDVHTALPGTVETYDPEAKRARVQPAIRLLLTDGTTRRRSPLINVPVVFPSGGGYTLLFPVEAGDTVLVVFSQRGLAAFKRAFEESDPTLGHLFDASDGVALPGFGALSVTPATSTGAALQTEDGATSIRVDGDTVEIVAPAQVTVRAARIDLN